MIIIEPERYQLMLYPFITFTLDRVKGKNNCLGSIEELRQLFNGGEFFKFHNRLYHLLMMNDFLINLEPLDSFYIGQGCFLKTKRELSIVSPEFPRILIIRIPVVV